ncbi:predicted protein [Plenodomus lingam JN3]|uniref:Predicted protein n=1 Tax=Leptosphaeria maculans (strain JN3 / isolate v23.1.3 / race Av1-4-5-6-7-8) TaxID=985895 RepID=E5A2U2_LEPMJ|nr:predicted protein [Plenodomus lingam JN3]CBX97888.1 predicted protein [Plenodomus lingam JN3]
MRSDFLLCAMVGMVSASTITPRGDNGYETKNGHESKPAEYKAAPALPMDAYETDKYSEAAKQKGYSAEPYSQGSGHAWRPKTSHPEFFSVRVDEQCDDGEDPATECQFDNYAIRLEQGIVIATPYNKWWDPKLPIFFVSKKPLQLFVDTVTGALRYAPVGFLPPNSIAFSFYKTGNNPLGNVDPSPAHLSWPSTQGNTLFGDGPWNLCALGNTGQYQVFVSNENYEEDIPSGVFKDPTECQRRSLAAINASPWRTGASAPY